MPPASRRSVVFLCGLARALQRGAPLLGLLVLLAALTGCKSEEPATRGDGPAVSGDGPAALDGPGSSTEAGSPDKGQGTADGPTPADASTKPDGKPASGVGPAAAVAKKLGLPARFLIGMGNDLAGAAENYDHDKDGAYTLGTKLDLHYAYLVGLKGSGGWPDWNSGGTFVNILTDSAAKHGVVPMFTLYSMAAWGEGNMSALTDSGYMKAYWDGARLLFQRLAVFNKPAVVQFEPDFWGYLQQKATGGDPTTIKVTVSSLASECAALPNDATGMGGCLVKLARQYAPKAIIGFHASRWAATTPAAVAQFLNKLGSSQADIVFLETLDRDAGCFEAHVDPNCQRNDGPWYWDETNKTSPNFSEHLAWAKAISTGTKKPLLWWQMPFGVPSTTAGGTAGKYRDNRVKYLFGHVSQFVAAGGLGAAFGTGAGNQTYITSDGGQFKAAVKAYYASPTALP